MAPMTILGTALLAAAASASASALSTPRLRRDDTGTSNNFRLQAQVVANDLTPSVSGLELAYNITSACEANLVFGATGSGSVFYTTSSPDILTGISWFPISTETTQAPMVVSPRGTATVPGSNVVAVSCNNRSTPGVTVAANAADGGVVELQFAGGKWMACPYNAIFADEPSQDLIVLSYAKAGQRILAVCAEVRLVPVCDSVQAAVSGSTEVVCYHPR